MEKQGAIKVKEDVTDTYQQAGRRLTREAALRLQGNCIRCKTKDDIMHLVHFSVDTSDTISATVCHSCSKKMTVYDLFETTLEDIIAVEEMRRSKHCTKQ